MSEEMKNLPAILSEMPSQNCTKSSWTHSHPKEEKGILVATDHNQEWLLPWWWEHYRKHNSYPVVFVDFGMSEASKEWCRQRGALTPLRNRGDFLKDFQELGDNEAILTMLRETELGKQFWNLRQGWFKKPFACLETPFQKTIWIDLDCEIRGSLAPLFSYKGLSMAIDQNVQGKGYPVYNSGVIPYSFQEPLIQEWAEDSLHNNRAFRSDQDLFSHMLKGRSILELPPIFNWTFPQPPEENLVIMHWYGTSGKAHIRKIMHD